MAVEAGHSTAQPGGIRKYPPLLLIAVAVFLAALALPSSLILPQASPAETLEYAPVPPNGSAPPGGNFAGLGLGSSGTIGAGGGTPALGALAGEGANPSSKQCVGSPPRQAEDPLSPPCVAFFSGGNGGATYAGVTRTEVRVLVYLSGTTASAGDTARQL